MLDIKHNGAEKKVNGSLKETEGLLIVSGVPKWQSFPGIKEGDETTYTAIFVDPRITAGHVMMSAKKSSTQPIPIIDDLELSSYDIKDGAISVTIDDTTVVSRKQTISIVLYDSTILETPSGMPMSLVDSVTFSNWSLINTGDEVVPSFSGTVAVKIDDEMLAPFLATIVYSSFSLVSNEGTVNINGIKEFLPDGRIACFVNFLPASSEDEDLIPPTSADNASMEFLYIASDNARITLPEATVDEWTQRLDGMYEATFTVGEELLDENATINELVIVRGENGEEFPVQSSAKGKLVKDPAMYSVLTVDKTTGSDVITVRWARDTMPEITKLTAEVLVKNYKDPEGFIPPMP